MTAATISESRAILAEIQNGLAQLRQLATCVAGSTSDAISDAIYGLALVAEALADKAQTLDETLPGGDA